MSLDAALLSLIPGVRKLRGLRVPKLPAAESISPNYSRMENMLQDFTISDEASTAKYRRLKHETHGLYLPLQATAVPQSFEICNLSGPGVINGLWLVGSLRFYSSDYQNLGVSCIIDGVEIIDQSWTYDQLNVPTGENYNTGNLGTTGSLLIPFIGTCHRTWNYYGYEVGGNYKKYAVARMNNEPQQVPFYFKNSLSVKLIRKYCECGITDTRLRECGSRLSVSAWQTE